MRNLIAQEYISRTLDSIAIDARELSVRDSTMWVPRPGSQDLKEGSDYSIDPRSKRTQIG